MESNLVPFLMRLHSEVRMYHWSTGSFARHKATDELYDTLSTWMDRFVEVLMGRNPAAKLKSFQMPVRVWTEKDAADRIGEAIAEVRSWTLEGDPALITLRDDLLAALHNTAYLFRLK